MKFKPPPSRKKVEPPPSSSSSLSCSTVGVGVPSPERRDAPMSMRKPMVAEVSQISSVDLRIKQARNYAMTEAYKDGWMGNFKLFESPFGNYIVPVIPTRAELDLDG